MNDVTQVVDTVSKTAPDVAQQGGTMGMIIYCAVIFAIIYLLMIRPNKKRMAEYQKMLESIKVGSRILVSGFYGTVKKINETTVEVEIAKGVVIEVSKNAIANVEK